MRMPLKPIAATAILGLSIVSGFAVAQTAGDADMAALDENVSAAQVQDSSATVQVGDVVASENLQLVEQPEKFGLSNAPDGDRYALVDDLLVRVDPANGKILSILREVDEGYD